MREEDTGEEEVREQGIQAQQLLSGVQGGEEERVGEGLLPEEQGKGAGEEAGVSKTARRQGQEEQDDAQAAEVDYEELAGGVVRVNDEVWKDVECVVKCMVATCHHVQDELERPCIECSCERCCKRINRLYGVMHRCHSEWWALDTILEEGGGEDE